MFECWSYDPKCRPLFEELHNTVKTVYIEQYSEQPHQPQQQGRDKKLSRMSSISSSSSLSNTAEVRPHRVVSQ